MGYADMVAEILENYAGLDASGPHGADTPRRFLEMLDELTKCKPGDCKGECIKWKTFPASSDSMIVMAPIPFVSVCNHHVLPFHGTAYIGYVPEELEVGLSKLARTVHHFARRLQVQE